MKRNNHTPYRNHSDSPRWAWYAAANQNNQLQSDQERRGKTNEESSIIVMVDWAHVTNEFVFSKGYHHQKEN